MMTLKLKNRLRVRLFKGLTLGKCFHGPQVWPWWRFFAVRFYKQALSSPTTGYEMIVYRPKKAWTFCLVFDRRDLSGRAEREAA